tara:strand:+ start:1125 stop:1664 length:540 start_codon:yes stop_codon:yes gene_type:complete
MNLLDYVLVDTVFTPEQCNEYIAKLNTKLWKQHTWYEPGSDKFHNVKDFSVTYAGEVQELMKPNVMALVENYYTTVKPDGDRTVNFSGVRFNKYQEGESIHRHVDHIRSLFDGTKKGIPILSYVGVFNDDYEGGDFMLCGEKIELKQGDVVVFPSVFMYPHEVTTVTKGTRYSWVLWSW